jgi:ssDNA-binding Zn-finger/Zn-ribbon topoisomerase 1
MTSDIIALKKEGEHEMAEFRCPKCGHVKGIYFQNYKTNDVLRGIVYCSCGGQALFEMKEQVLSFVSEKDIFPSLNQSVPQDTQDRFMEAKLCYFAPALRATAVMQRACLELALTEKGFNKGTLEERVEDALKKGQIEKQQYLLAHGTRLVGNDAIHTSKVISPASVLAAFGALSEILNSLFLWGRDKST